MRGGLPAPYLPTLPARKLRGDAEQTGLPRGNFGHLSRVNNDLDPQVVSQSAPSLSPPRRKLERVLLPDSIVRPWVVAAVWVVPQVILAIINLQAWNLAAGEMSASQTGVAARIFSAQMLSLAAGAALCIWLWIGRKPLSRLLGLIPLILGSLALGMVFSMAAKAIPAALADWMLPTDQWMLKQFALTMPAVLFGGFRVLCPDRAGSRFAGLGWSILQVALLAGGCVGFIFLAVRVGSVEGFMTGFAVIYIGMTTLLAAAFLRLGVSAYVWARATSPWALATVTLIVALAGPLGGLALNSSIPFPFDFQTSAIYALTVINGLILLLPNFSNPILHRIVWLAQCALFPFSVYFCAVFLPFLPLGPLGMLSFMLGALIYVPSLLFLLHGYRILDGFQGEIREGKRWIPATLGLAALLAWPVGYTLQAGRDRAALNHALDYLHYPNYSPGSRYDGGLSALRSSLLHLRDFKRGFYMPYLSEYYNWLTFDNLVLPEEKLNTLFLTFFGEPTPALTAKQTNGIFLADGSRRRNFMEVLGDVQGTRPSTDAVLGAVKTGLTSSEGASRLKASITIANPTGAVTECATEIRIPPGVMISGLWLTVGDELVPGRIFEKRAAMWVYQKITEVRPVPRDPAILRYTGPGTAELRVYPVEPRVPRHVEVEFLFPGNLNPTIQIGKELLSVPPTGPQATVAASPDGALRITIPPDVAARLPGVIREPYLHFVADHSKDSKLSSPEALRSAMRRASESFPGVKRAKLTFANFESREFQSGKILPLEALLNAPDDALRNEAGPARGGFLSVRAVKEVAWRNHLGLADDESFASYPKIIVLQGSTAAPLPDETGNLPEFARLLPDEPGYWILDAEKPRRVAFGPGTTSDDLPHVVQIYQIGGERFLASGGGSVDWTTLAPHANKADLEVYEPGSRAFQKVTAVQDIPSPQFANAIRPWALELTRIFEPFRHQQGDLGRLLAICRETGILVPSATYMVVENSAQWKMLEKTEKKALSGHEALAISESTPEPSTIALVAVGLAAFAVWRLRGLRARPMERGR